MCFVASANAHSSTDVAVTIRRAGNYGFCSGVRIADLEVSRFAGGGGRGSVLGQLVHNDAKIKILRITKIASWN